MSASQDNFFSRALALRSTARLSYIDGIIFGSITTITTLTPCFYISAIPEINIERVLLSEKLDLPECLIYEGKNNSHFPIPESLFLE